MVAAALLLVAGGASAAKVKTRTVKNVALSVTGSLTYTWNGDPAGGCAAAGVCGTHGELILRPQPRQSVAPGVEPFMVVLDSSSAARVVREKGGAVVGECVDLPASSFNSLFFSLPSRRAPTATIQSPPSSGRCAGPTGADLAAVSIPVRRTGRVSFDLTGTRSFTAGPFSGTLVSTMRIVPAPSSSPEGSTSTSTSTSSGPSRPVQTASAPMIEFVELRYRVSAARTAIQAQFSGAADSSCQILDACGATGSLAFSLEPSRTFSLIGERQVHRRFSRRQVLNDLRQGRLSLTSFGPVAAQVNETFNWPGGSSCHDSVMTPSSTTMPSLLLGTGSPVTPRTAGRTVPVTVNANGGTGDVFRTHCPGPDDTDLFGQPPNGGNETYAQGSITTAQLLARRSVLTLSNPGSFSGLGYVGSRSGSIDLDLTLTKVTAEMQR